jgi:hypothetical protein
MHTSWQRVVQENHCANNAVLLRFSVVLDEARYLHFTRHT